MDGETRAFEFGGTKINKKQNYNFSNNDLRQRKAIENNMNESDFDFQRKVQKYYQLTIYLRWIGILLLWLTLGIYGIRGIRHEISLWFDYFTWSAVRYGLAFNLIPTICLGICIGMTVSALLSQSRHILWGLSDREKYFLAKKVEKILAVGASHPFWKWIH